MDYTILANLRRNHPAWRLLAADSAPFVIAFFHRTFIEPNVRVLSEKDLTAKLEDHLYHLRRTVGEEGFPKSARDYLLDWAGDTRGWLRRYYPPDSDEPHFDLTPAAERAVQWLASLQQTHFVGAESRLKLVFDLLRQVAMGGETDPDVRLNELKRRRAEIDAEIERFHSGALPLMDPTQLRERFVHATDTARALLADFRQVEQNFRDLDRQVRERITTADGGKGALLEEIFDERDAIVDSDQGRSFRAFWDFLMSPARQEELTALLEQVLALEAVVELSPDPRLKRVHYDWLTAGEVTQRTVARLSEQLRRYLDDQAWFENRRIMEVLRNLEQRALAMRDEPPRGSVMPLDAASPTVALPMERPLFSPPVKPVIEARQLVEGEADVDTRVLFEQFYVDKERLRARLRKALQTRRQISLAELLDAHPLEQGLAELVAWLSLATGEESGVVDEDSLQSVTWREANGRMRQATLPTVIFVGGAAGTTHA